jgi:hypothetical protein
MPVQTTRLAMNIKYVLVFTTTSAGNISYSKKNSAG